MFLVTAFAGGEYRETVSSRICVTHSLFFSCSGEIILSYIVLKKRELLSAGQVVPPAYSRYEKKVCVLNTQLASLFPLVIAPSRFRCFLISTVRGVAGLQIVHPAASRLCSHTAAVAVAASTGPF